MIKYLSFILFLIITKITLASETPSTHVQLKRQINTALAEYRQIKATVAENPVWQQLFDESCPTRKRLSRAFYATPEGKTFAYWDMKLDALIKMKSYYKGKIAATPKSSLYIGLYSALNVDHWTKNKDKQEVREQVNEELTNFIETIKR